MIGIYLWVEFILFMLVMVVLSYIAAKKTKTIEDFAISGASLGPIVLGLSFAATFFSAATFMGYPGFSYAWGYSNLWLFLSLICAAPLGISAVANVVRKANPEQKPLALPDWGRDYSTSYLLRFG